LDDMSLLYITPIMSGASESLSLLLISMGFDSNHAMIVGLICHGIFAYRLYSLSGSWVVCSIVVLVRSSCLCRPHFYV
jgi:hypothetical protein